MSVTEERTQHIFSKRGTLCSPTIVANRMNQITRIPRWIPFSHPFLTHSDIFTNILAFWSTYPICEFFYLKERCGCSLEDQEKGTSSNSAPESKKLDLYNDIYCFWIIVRIFFSSLLLLLHSITRLRWAVLSLISRHLTFSRKDYLFSCFKLHFFICYFKVHFFICYFTVFGYNFIVETFSWKS